MNINWNFEQGRPVPSEQELFALGLEDIAFVKPMMEEGELVFGIYSADGSQVGQAPSRELAFAAIRQHDLEPASVH